MTLRELQGYRCKRFHNCKGAQSVFMRLECLFVFSVYVEADLCRQCDVCDFANAQQSKAHFQSL